MFKIKCLKEFYCVVDMLIGSLRCGDSISISVKCSGLIRRYINGKSDIAQITESPAKINAIYDDSGFIVCSTVTKSIAKWLSLGSSNQYKHVNSYLTFISSIDEIIITSVIFNSDEIIDSISDGGNISVYRLVNFVSGKKELTAIKLNLINGNKRVSLVYDNGIFCRYVKSDGTYTLYINDNEKFDNMFGKYHLSSFMFGYNLPDIMSQLDLLQSLADANECKYRYVQ